MDDKTKTVMLTIATGVIKKGLIVAGTGLASHGVISSSQTEMFVAAGMGLVGLGWSFWNDYGKAIVLSQLEVLKAKSLAQAAKLQQNSIPPVTTRDIANQSPTLTPTEVAKTVATLPEEIQANVAKTVALAGPPDPRHCWHSRAMRARRSSRASTWTRSALFSRATPAAGAR
jgi:hypothetical protein